MRTLDEQALFTDNIYEVAVTDKAMGGPEGTVNVQPRQLAYRTKYLKNMYSYAHLDIGRHDAEELKVSLEEEIEDTLVAPNAHIRETKLDLDFVNTPRPIGTGTYSTTEQLAEDITTLEIMTAENDLLQSEANVQTLGAVYSTVYPSSGDIYIGSTALSGHDVVGEGGLFCKKASQITSEEGINRVRFEGDIRKLVGHYNVFPVSPYEKVFPVADTFYSEGRTDLLYLRCKEVNLSEGGSFYVRGFTAGTAIDWAQLSSISRRGYLTDAPNNVFLHHTGDAYQLQYSFEVAVGEHTLLDIGYSRVSLDTNLYSDGEFNATPIAIVQRMNTGCFHPIYNLKGTGFFSKNGNLALDDTRFLIGDAAQLLNLNNDFVSWDKSTEATVIGSVITGAQEEGETIFTSVSGVEGGTQYLFCVDLKKVEGDIANRSLHIGVTAENASGGVLASAIALATLGEDYATIGVVLETPAADVDHLVLKIGTNGTCDFSFEAKDARCSKDIVPPATKYDLGSTNTALNTFSISGDHADEFPTGWDIVISGSSTGSESNDGTFTVASVLFDGTKTTIGVTPGITYNTGNVGSLESKSWHYIDYCFTHQSLGIGDRTTGSVLSGRTGRFDSKFHDVLYADDFMDHRTVLVATEEGGVRATLSTPIISGVPATVNETDQIVLTISNYSADYTYYATVSMGEFFQVGATITWTMPEVASGRISGTLTLYATNAEGEFSEMVSVETTAVHVAIVADEGINEQSFEADDFVFTDGVSIEDGSLVGDGSAVTQAYIQEGAGGGWVKVQGNLSLVGELNKSIPLHTDTTATSIVSKMPGGTSQYAPYTGQIGVTVNGIDKVVEIENYSLTLGEGLSEVEIQASLPMYSSLVCAQALGPSMTMVVYAGKSSSNSSAKVMACILFVEGNNIIVGPPIVVDSGSPTLISITLLSPTKVLVVYTKQSSLLTMDLYSCILSLEGTTILQGYRASIGTAAISTYLWCVTLTPVKALLLYMESSFLGLVSSRKAKVLTIADEAVFQGGSEAAGYSGGTVRSCTTLNANQVLGVDLGEDRDIVFVLTTSGDTVSTGPATRLVSSYYYVEAQCTVLSPNKVLFVGRTRSSRNNLDARILTLNGTSVTVGPPVIFGVTTYSALCCTTMSPNRALLVTTLTEGSKRGVAWVFSIEGTTIQYSAPVDLSSIPIINTCCVPLTPNRALVTYEEATGARQRISCIVDLSLDELNLTVEDLGVVPTAAWVPSYKLPACMLYKDSSLPIPYEGSVHIPEIPTLSYLKGARYEHVAYLDYPLALNTDLTTANTVVGTSSVPGLWGAGWIHNQVGLEMASGETMLATVIASDEERLGDESTYTLTIDTPLLEAPTRAWKPTQLLPHLPLEIDVARTTASKVVGTSSVHSGLLGRDKVELQVDGGEIILADIAAGAEVMVGDLSEYSLDIEAQTSVPTKATLVGNSQLPQLITYDKNTSRMGIQYQEEEMKAVKQLKFGIGNIQEGQRVDNLVVDLWRTY